MKNNLLFFCCFCLFIATHAQTVTVRLEKALGQFEQDSQLRNSLSSLYVVDAATGKVVYEKNASIGLAPASTQKIITSATAYELLGKDFRYKTDVIFTDNNGAGRLCIKASGDPSLGSWRWSSTKENVILSEIIKGITQKNIQHIDEITVDASAWEDASIPNDWILEDIANYYGAGCESLNWRENQFDIFLKSGTKVGDPVTITGTEPKLYAYRLESYLKTATKGTGDKSYIFFPLQTGAGVLRGTIPAGEDKFVVSGAFPSAARQFAETLRDEVEKSIHATPVVFMEQQSSAKDIKENTVYTHYSPSLDSLVYWLNKKSINLYAEAFIKTMALQKKGFASREDGIELLQSFWQQRGIPKTELNMVDGSGLSPVNRVTTRAQVTILQYARRQPWFSGFYNSLPEYNGMKMKSGTIGGVKGFAGYHQSKDGKTYVFSFLVNNYNGSTSSLVQKMYEVLNELK